MFNIRKYNFYIKTLQAIILTEIIIAIILAIIITAITKKIYITASFSLFAYIFVLLHTLKLKIQIQEMNWKIEIYNSLKREN